jgi:hypothetical protein
VKHLQCVFKGRLSGELKSSLLKSLVQNALCIGRIHAKGIQAWFSINMNGRRQVGFSSGGVVAQQPQPQPHAGPMKKKTKTLPTLLYQSHWASTFGDQNSFSAISILNFWSSAFHSNWKANSRSKLWLLGSSSQSARSLSGVTEWAAERITWLGWLVHWLSELG